MPRAKKAAHVSNRIQEGVARTRREMEIPVRYYDTVPDVDVKAIRTKLKLSQSEFSTKFRFPLRTLQDWELGRNQPLTPIRAYLIVIDKEPVVVEKALRRAEP
jgi:putative transcriptional regulator